MKYYLDVVFPFDETFAEKSDYATKLVGKHSGSSGAGFGQRDMQFYFDTLEECEVAKNKFLTEQDYDVSIHKSED